MKLTFAELQWVQDRMEIYVIKFQEIYDEILDHIITAIEERRTAGDATEISILFQQVVDRDFNGYIGIEGLAVSEEKIYRKNIRDLFYNRLKQLFNWQTLIVAVVMLAISYKVPDVKFVHVVLLVSIFLLAVSPLFYAYIAIAGKIRTIAGKRSLLKTYLITQVGVPIALLNAIFYFPVIFNLFDDDDNFKLIKHLPPVVLMAILLFFLLTNISYIQASKELIDKNMLKQPGI